MHKYNFAAMFNFYSYYKFVLNISGCNFKVTFEFKQYTFYTDRSFHIILNSMNNINIAETLQQNSTLIIQNCMNSITQYNIYIYKENPKLYE